MSEMVPSFLKLLQSPLTVLSLGRELERTGGGALVAYEIHGNVMGCYGNLMEIPGKS